MSDWKSLALAAIEMLPVGFRKKIPESYLDSHAHLHVM
jgi:hypothetical protein